MKLEQNEKPLQVGEGLSLDQIYVLGCRAHFEGRVDEGIEYFRQIRPEHGDLFIRANGFLSQVLSFSRNYDQALECALGLLKACPNNPLALHYAGLIHCYREEYEQAGKLHGSYKPEPYDRSGYYYQAACILAGLKEYESSLLALSMSLESGGAYYCSKLWYDPELVFLWAALPAIAEQAAVREILLKAYWLDLLDSYDPAGPFDQLDPGNLRSFSIEEMHFVGVVPSGPMAYLMEERRSDSPQIYDSLVVRLNKRREDSVQGLKKALSLIAKGGKS